MLKKTFTLLFTYLTLATHTHAGQSNFITYDWLAEKGEESAYTDHVPHWRRLFNTMQVRGFLECGCGFSTGYFLDNAQTVVSVEYATPGYGLQWHQYCVELFSDRSNWVPMIYNEEHRSNSFNNACAYQSAMQQDYALIDAAYLRELFQHYKGIIKKAQTENYDIDVAFVDPGICIRGDMVKLLLAHKIPVVTACGTALDKGTEEKKNIYGWNKVKTPDDYTKIYIPYGQGTTFWISNQLPLVIASMEEYRDGIIQLQDLGFGISMKDLKEMADERL
jgi:hypothetical protein